MGKTRCGWPRQLRSPPVGPIHCGVLGLSTAARETSTQRSPCSNRLWRSLRPPTS
jgi:hypothetical protein